jgi:hypothetical protein
MAVSPPYRRRQILHVRETIWNSGRDIFPFKTVKQGTSDRSFCLMISARAAIDHILALSEAFARCYEPLVRNGMTKGRETKRCGKPSTPNNEDVGLWELRDHPDNPRLPSSLEPWTRPRNNLVVDHSPAINLLGKVLHQQKAG